MTQLNRIPFGNIGITIYNKYTYSNTSGKLMTKWVRKIVKGCFRTTAQKMDTSSGAMLVSNDSIAIQIPLYDNFLEPYDWLAIVNDETPNYFTVNDGDVIVMKQVDDEVDPDLGTIDEIKNKYGSMAFTVNTVNYNYGEGYPLQHIAVIGE